ncbi:MAG: polysaccharide deacetylase family protein [Phycisphaerae bacterium]|nr:polysaccharide deacetylase family protein [Phycisphaerae bacterium]
MIRDSIVAAAVLLAVLSCAARGEATTPNANGPRAIDVPILVYHRVTCLMGNPTRMDERMTVAPEAFALQMQRLRDEGYTSVGLGEVRAALEGSCVLPPKPIVITFDDGWESQYSEAFPVLRRLGFHATFFVFTDAVGCPGHVTWDQVREMRSAGMEIGSHTLSHARLPGLEPWPMWKELAWSKDRIEHELDEPVEILAYPFGEWDDAVIAASERAGYREAVTTDAGVTQRADGVMRLRRTFVGFMDGPDEFADALRGRVNWEPMRAEHAPAGQAARRPG